MVWAHAASGRADRSAPAQMDDAVRAQFAALGVSVKEEAAPREERHFEVMEENWASVVLFLSLATQWRMHFGPRGHAVWLGLDYSAAESLMRIERVQDRPGMMRDLRIMEAAALPVLNGGTPAEGDASWL